MTLQYIQEQIQYAKNNNYLFIGLALKDNTVYPNILLIPKDNFDSFLKYINSNYDKLNIVYIELGFTINKIIDNIYNHNISSFSFTNYFSNNNMNETMNKSFENVYSTFSFDKNKNNNYELSFPQKINMNDEISIQDSTVPITIASNNSDPLHVINDYIDNTGLIYNYCNNTNLEINNTDFDLNNKKDEKKYNDFSYQFQKLTKEQLIEILSSLSEEELEELGYKPIK